MKPYLALFLLALLASANAAELTIDEVCAQTPCSPAKGFTVRVTEESYFRGEWPMRPYFYDDTGSILIGETVSFEVVAAPDGSITLNYLPEQSESSLTFHLYQPGENREDVSTLAAIDNRSGHNITYKGFIYRTESGRVVDTSVCALPAGMSAFESWPYGISMLLITDLKAVSDDEASSYGCR